MIAPLRALLAVPAVYRVTIGVLGSDANRRWFINEVLRLRPGDKLVDVGCGPGDILRLLPPVTYVGCDVSAAYVRAAERRYGDRGAFIAGTSDDWARDHRTHGADVVLCNGVLHHVDDEEALRLLQFARDVLRPGGRCVFYEPCYLIWQSRLSAFFMSKDRGRHIRREQEWKQLAARVFDDVTTHVVTDVNRLGYTCIIADCRTPTR